jgi:hypothetical protein
VANPPNPFRSRVLPSFARTPAAANAVADVPPDLIPKPLPLPPASGDVGIGGRYAEQLNRSGYLDSALPVLTPTENFFVDEIVRRIRASGLGIGGNVNPWWYDPLRFIEPTQLALTIGTDDQVVLQRPSNKRIYLYINNTHATQRIFVTFGTPSSTTLGVPIEANLGWFEWIYPIPQNDVHLIANGATTTAVLMYAEMDPRAFGLTP